MATHNITKDNEEYHELLNIITEKKMFGEVTLYVQNGNIESHRISERVTKTEMKAIAEERKKKKYVVRKESNG
jgi:TfoX/Sxy family transcriptional regulator of competence genes